MPPSHHDDTEVQPGQVLAGKYEIERVLGRGGMGVVVAARHVQLDERVALKFLLPDALRSSEVVKRFEREARAAVKIKSEHVARVTDVGELDNGSPYMVMEYLDGVDLGDYLARNGPLPVQEAVDYLIQACEAIAEAHSLGIVHRDLKPANLFRIVRAGGAPSIKVLDFGISKVVADQSMTQTSSMMGSPYYMSPEQMTSARTVDGRTDIWALGVILQELLTGQVPYQGDTVPEICIQVIQQPAPPLAQFRSDVPEGVQEVISRALEKNREARFGDVAAFTDALAPFGSEQSAHYAARISRVLGKATAASQVKSTMASSTEAHDPNDDSLSETTFAGGSNTQLAWGAPGASRTKLYGLLAALLALAVLVAAAFVFSSQGPDDEDPDAFEANAAAGLEGPPTSSVSETPEPKPKPEPQPQPKAEPQPTPRPQPAPQPQPQPTPQPAPRPQVQPQPTPRPAATPSPQPAPAPTPAPAPKPDPSSLYLDRK